MKIAVISDVHGNLPALEAVMKDISRRAVDKIICLGDIIGKGPSSKEAIDICRNECDLVIIGNWEDSLFKNYTVLNEEQGYEQSEFNDRTLWYVNNIGGLRRLEYLSSLPHSTEFYLSGKLVRLFHAHPRNFNRYFADSPVEQRLELFDFGDSSEIKERADVAIYADIHTAYMQVLQGRLLLNTGSVGNPLDITQASYIILEGGESKESSFDVQFIRLPYDIERAVAIAKECGVLYLDGYISELRTAKYFSRG